MVATSPLVLIVVQNLPLPGDRRVWLECRSLRDRGFRVAAITPAAPGDPTYENYDGVHLFKYKPPPATNSVLSFFWEFAYCWVQTFFLTLRVVLKIGRPAVLQACNPPDTYFLLGLLLRPFGTKFVFDQHDLNPEVYESRFGKRGALYRALVFLEKCTYRTACEVIVTNESYAEVARTRGKLESEVVTVVRTGPDTSVLKPGDPSPDLMHGKKFLVHFHGVMGPQDGVDIVVDTVDYLVNHLKRRDVFFSILGKGDAWTELKEAVHRLALDDYVYMPGRVSDEELFAHLSTATVGLSADPPGPLNDVSTMNKTMEYMAFGVPVVAFDLKETRHSAGASAIYVEPPTPTAYGDAVSALLDDEGRRQELGRAGIARATGQLDWKFQKDGYVNAIARAGGFSTDEIKSPQERGILK
jgi:glycosyltransferase involved in cell wall biosynthesis